MTADTEKIANTFKLILTLSGDSTTFQYLDADTPISTEYEILSVDELVSCRECKYAHPTAGVKYTCTKHGIRISVPPDHYCSFGVKR